MAMSSNSLVIDGEKLRKTLEEKGLKHGETSIAIGKADNYIAGSIRTGVINKTAIMLLANLYGITYDSIKPDEKVEEKVEETPVAQTIVTETVDIEPILKKLDAIMYAQQKSDTLFEEKMNDLIGTMNRLGNILMQSMEYQKSTMGSADEIKGCVRQIKNFKK